MAKVLDSLLLICALTLGFAPIVSHASSAGQCAAIFTFGTRDAKSAHDLSAFANQGISVFPTVAESPLPPDFVHAVHAHKVTRHLRSQFSRGQDMTVALFSGVHSGEGIQAQFVIKVLREILPQIEIVERPQDATRAQVIQLRVTDSMEFGVTPYADQPGRLEMSVLKHANPGPAQLPRHLIRSALGIESPKRVISLTNSVYNDAGTILELLRSISTLNPDFVITSSGGIIEDSRLSTVLPNNWRLIKLSEIHERSREPGLKFIVHNDTRGLMQVVYGLSDLSIVAGAVNLSEPILAKTPMIFFDSSTPFMHDYDRSVFEAMAERAMQTGGAIPAKNHEEMLASAAKLLHSMKTSGAPIQPPWRVGKPGATALDEFLQHLAAQF